jgi:uncharacterized protein (DUF924 family)
MPTPDPIAESVLTHWFADGLQLGWPSANMHALWFGGGAAQDQRIAALFGASVARALAGELLEWEASARSRLALIVLLDQFTRNVHRGSARAFSGDGRAQQLVLQALAQGTDENLPTVGRVFFYMPLMHAENQALQNECLGRFTRLHASAPEALQAKLLGNVQAAQQHLDIIERFGRFPHRNAVLGRTSTPQEIEFLETGPRFGQ